MQGSIASEGLCCLADVGLGRRNLLIPFKGVEQSWPGWALAHLGTSG